MNFVSPVSALIPGATGRILAVLAATESELTLRQLRERARVSVNHVSDVIDRLAELGVVTRREVPPSSLVRLDDRSLAAALIRDLADLRSLVIARARALAEEISPPPVSLVTFGSFARGEAGAGSDIDVLAVRPHDAEPDQWTDSLGSWCDALRAAAGSSVALIEVGEDELRDELRDRPLWASIVDDGVLLFGKDPARLAPSGG